MRNFLSWIETYEGKLFYLTDEDIFSPKGVEMMSEYHDKSYGLTHRAIREFFNLDKEYGECKKEELFWKSNNLPEEIAQKVKEFDKYWGKMFRSYFFNYSDLCGITDNTSEKWNGYKKTFCPSKYERELNKRAWEQFCIQVTIDNEKEKMIEEMVTKRRALRFFCTVE